MADEIVYKKMYRKADQYLKDTIPVAHGKKANQKMKPYIVLQYCNSNIINLDTSHFNNFEDNLRNLSLCGILFESALSRRLELWQTKSYIKKCTEKLINI